MPTCKDCIHYEPCKDSYYNAEQLSRFPLGFLEKENAEKNCAFFKDRSKFVEFSHNLKKGDKLYYICEDSIFGGNSKLYVGEYQDIVTAVMAEGFFTSPRTDSDGTFKPEQDEIEAIERTKATRFKQGGLPHNTKPIGYERINADGYIEVKVRMRPDRVNHKYNFVAKHILVWEEHNGPIPEGMIVRFLDGNKLNCSIDNLVLMTRAEHLQLTRSKHYSDDPEITKTGVALAKLNIAITNHKDKI